MILRSQPRGRRRIATGAAALLSISTATFALWACGPYFPNWILGRDEIFLNSPGGVLRVEIERLKLPADPFHALSAEDPWQQTADADAADLQKALGKDGMPPEKRAEIVTRHAELRKLLHDFALNTANAGHPENGMETPAPAPIPAGTAAPAGLPGEIADYLQGAIAYHQGRLPDATAAWQRLLHRPAAERRLRSTWAAFMLGKVALKGDRKDAVHWFQSTREMAAHGFEDSLGLAAASLGWEARAERDLGHFDRALALYARQARSGDTTALSSLQFVCRQAFQKGPDALNPIARSADARDVMTAFLVSDHHGPWELSYADPDADAAAKAKPAVAPDAAAWLKAIKVAMIKDVSGAERLAWAAYQGGDFAAAQEWVQRAPADATAAPMARWVRAKLLLRDGKVAEAQKLLDEVARTLPSPTPEDLERYDPSQDAGKVATPALAHGENGALLLTQGHYTEALEHFLHGGFWMEGAYISERLLTVDELKKFVDAGWPERVTSDRVADPNREPGDTESIGLYAAGVDAPDLPKLTHTLRYLLGRRLVRSGRLGDARPYMPADVLPYLEALDKALREGHDTARPADQRARSLFQAACITRKKGMEIAGTENEPDWLALYGGNYELPTFPEDVAKRADNSVLKPAADEKERAGKSRVEPEKRFHYRYRAADLTREAAALLPDGAEDKARMLSTGGGWLKARDPEAAEPFLKALVSCCATTKLGKQAQRTHNLPEAPECSVEVPEVTGVPGVKQP